MSPCTASPRAPTCAPCAWPAWRRVSTTSTSHSLRTPRRCSLSTRPARCLHSGTASSPSPRRARSPATSTRPSTGPRCSPPTGSGGARMNQWISAIKDDVYQTWVREIILPRFGIVEASEEAIASAAERLDAQLARIGRAARGHGLPRRRRAHARRSVPRTAAVLARDDAGGQGGAHRSGRHPALVRGDRRTRQLLAHRPTDAGLRPPARAQTLLTDAPPHRILRRGAATPRLGVDTDGRHTVEARRPVRRGPSSTTRRTGPRPGRRGARCQTSRMARAWTIGSGSSPTRSPRADSPPPSSLLSSSLRCSRCSARRCISCSTL